MSDNQFHPDLEATPNLQKSKSIRPTMKKHTIKASEEMQVQQKSQKNEELEFIVTQLSNINKQIDRETRNPPMEITGIPFIPMQWLRECIKDIQQKSLDVDVVSSRLFDEIIKLLSKIIELSNELNSQRRTKVQLGQTVPKKQKLDNILTDLNESQTKPEKQSRQQQQTFKPRISPINRRQPKIELEYSKDQSLSEHDIYGGTSQPWAQQQYAHLLQPEWTSLEEFIKPIQVHNEEIQQQLEKVKNENHKLALELASKTKQIAELAIQSMQKSTQYKTLKDQYKQMKQMNHDLNEEKSKLKTKFDEYVDIMQIQQRKIEEYKAELDLKEEQLAQLDELRQPTEQEIFDYALRVVNECCNLLVDQRTQSHQNRSTSSANDFQPNISLDDSIVPHSQRISHKGSEMTHNDVVEICLRLMKERINLNDNKEATLKQKRKRKTPSQSFLFALFPRQMIDNQEQERIDRENMRQLKSIGRLLKDFFNYCHSQLVFVSDTLNNHNRKGPELDELQNLIHIFCDLIENNKIRYEVELTDICSCFQRSMSGLMFEFDRFLKDSLRKLKHVKIKNLSLSKQLLKL